MDNKEFDSKMRDIAASALSDAYDYATDHKSLEALIRTAEMAGKMIDFSEPAFPAGFQRRKEDGE